MPSVRAKAFQSLFARALEGGGRASQGAIDALVEAAARISDSRERRAASDLLKLVKDDRALDQHEVEPARRALCRLLGTSSKRLPAALERVLAGAVPVPNVRVKSYDLDFDFSKDAPSFPARARITLEAPAPRPAILEVDPERLAIDEVRVGGRAVPFTVRDGRIFVDTDGARDLDIRYRVTPTDDPHGYGLIRDRFAGRMWTLTWPYSTGALFPSVSHPSDGATATVRVRVAKGTDVVGPGKQRGDGTFRVAEVPSYAVSFYAGRFTDRTVTRAGRVDVVTQGLGRQMTKAERRDTREAVAHAVEFFSRWLGAYPVGDRLNIVEVNHSYGGMEHAGAIAVAVADKESHLEAAVHETAHHWFGDGVRIEERGEYWMSEGFVQYATFRAFEEREGPAVFKAMLEDARSRVQSELDAGPRALSNVDPAAAYDDFFHDVTYAQGPWMLRMIEAGYGRARFDRLLRGWYQEKKGTAVTTKDFVAFMKRETGDDLTAFFAAWNNLKALPSFRDESAVRDGALKVHLIKRAPVPTGMRMPLVVTAADGRTHTFSVDPTTRPVLQAPFPIATWAWDPECTVLCEVS